ncbi:hypothetical protein [Edaphobacter aggregans]|nr:hypothetical protein [Edaphobacter aggregans]
MSTYAAVTAPTQFVEANGIRFYLDPFGIPSQYRGCTAPVLSST